MMTACVQSGLRITIEGSTCTPYTVYLLAAELDLAGTGDVQIAQVGLQVAVGLEFHQRLGNGLLEVIGIRAAGLDNLGADSHLQCSSPVF